MDINKETIRVTLTVTLETEDGSPIGRLHHDLEGDLVKNIERCIGEGMLTIGHDDLNVDDYDIEVETVG